MEWVAYADDIVIAVKDNSRLKLERLSGRCLSHLMSWCLSTPKTKYMLIKGHMDRSKMPRVLCAGERIECVRQYKYLGVILDSVPNFVEHAKWVRAKVSTYKFFPKAHVGRGWGIQRRVVETLYDTVCTPMIAYGGEEWAKSMTKSREKTSQCAASGATPYTDTRLYSHFYCLSRTGSWPYTFGLFDCFHPNWLWQTS